MEYKFLDNSTDTSEITLKESPVIHPCLLENNKNDIIKSLDFLASEEKFLYVHGFLGTGKRQFVNYLCEYLAKDVIKLEYYCKEATVCDDILLMFTDLIESLSISKSISINAKITTLGAKFQKQLSSIKKPFLIILHSLDNVSEEQLQYIKKTFSEALKNSNVKIIITTRAMKQNLLGDLEEDRKVFLKAYTKELFKKYLSMNKIEISDKQLEDLYSLTRGYYFYTALTVKIIQPLTGFLCVRVLSQVTFLNIARGVCVQSVFQVEALVGLVLEYHHLDICHSLCFRIELYPFIQFKNGADALRGVRLVIESLSAATVSKQRQACHDGLFVFFDINEIQLAKRHRVLILCGIDIGTEDCRRQGKYYG